MAYEPPDPSFAPDDRVIDYVAARVSLPVEMVVKILDLEVEWMCGVGIVEDGEDRKLFYYRLEEFEGALPEVDTSDLARKAEAVLGVPFLNAAEVYEMEFDYLLGPQ